MIIDRNSLPRKMRLHSLLLRQRIILFADADLVKEIGQRCVEIIGTTQIRGRAGVFVSPVFHLFLETFEAFVFGLFSVFFILGYSMLGEFLLEDFECLFL